MAEDKPRTYFSETVFRTPATPDNPRLPEKVDIAKIETWLESKWKGSLACPICNEKSWFISDQLLGLLTPPILFRQQLSYPAVQLICTVCGYVMLFNWGIILHGGSSRG